jgi:WD40 repeat protein
VQSLLAIGTKESKFGVGQIYVFGQKRVSAIFELQRRSSVRTLQFFADKLVCLDVKNDLSIFSLETKRLLSSYSPPGIVLATCCDPSIDYIFLGMQSGDVLAFDMDRGQMAPFKLPSFWKEYDPRAKITPIRDLALHPRDIGTLLIGYAEGAVIYSFKQNKPLRFFRYEVPRGAPGGDGDAAAASVVRRPPLMQAVWHPTGTFILTGHEDGSLVFWDAKDGRVVMARTLTDTNIDKPSSMGMRGPAQGQGNLAVKEPLYKIVWCANQDPEDTAILISGGASSTSPAKGLTLLELGRTPVYTTSSWQVLSQYLESPKRQRMLPIPPNTEVVDFCLIPKSSPYFAGAHDPIAMLALLGSGEIISMSFPSGFPISPTNQVHVSLTFVHPFITSINLSPIDRSKWLGMIEKRSTGPLILKGGAEAVRPMKRFENRNIVQTAHADGTIRLWDAGHGDEIENYNVLQVDVDCAVGRPGGVEISKMSLAGASGEFSVGTGSGEVVVFRWNHNRNFGREPPEPGPPRPGELIDITNRGDAELSDGLLPYTMVDMQNGPVTALKNSDVGFVAAGFKGGSIIVIDMRGPALIFNANLKDFAQQEKRSFGRHGNRAQSQGDYPTVMEFSVSHNKGSGLRQLDANF